MTHIDNSVAEIERQIKLLDEDTIALQIARDKEVKGEANSVYATASAPGCLDRCKKIEADLGEKRALLQAAKRKLQQIREQRDTAKAQLEASQQKDLKLQLNRESAIREELGNSARLELEEASKDKKAIETKKRKSQELAQEQLESLDRRNQRLQRYETYARTGELDPLEEMVGLYYVILGMKPELAWDAAEGQPQGPSVRLSSAIEGGTLRVLLALFQFFTLYGTLFVLDLIPMLAKLMSPSGSYDAIISANETIARENYNAFRRSYPRGVQDWAEARFSAIEGDRVDQDDGPDIRQPATLDDLVMRVHRPPREAQIVYPEAEPRGANGGNGPSSKGGEDE